MAKILIVDDRPINRQFLLTLLGYGGHDLLEAADGAEALKSAQTERPDLVITDMLMPTMSGYDFVQRLRADAAIASTPVIFYTASYSEPQARALADSCGVDIVLPKPCDPEKVLAAVNQTLKLPEPIAVPPLEQHRVAAAALDADEAERTVSTYIYDLQTVRQGFERIIAGHGPTPDEWVAAQDLSAEFSKKLAALTLMASRLYALVKVGLELIPERSPEQMAQRCFEAACGIVGAGYTALGIFDERQANLRHLCSKGVDAQLFKETRYGCIAPLVDVCEQKRPIRLKAGLAGALPGFPPEHPPVKNFLGVPIATSSELYGWLYFADRLGAEEFSHEDERIAATLALKVALVHENFLLYDTLQVHATQLQLEVTERLRAEREILRLNELLERRIAARTMELEVANKELEAFSYSVSHDLRNPLNAIQGFVDLLHKELDLESLTGDQRKFLQHIGSSARRMRTLIDALLRLSQVSRQTLSRDMVTMRPLVLEVLEESQSQQPDRNMEVKVDDLPDGSGDAGMLKQVFANLLSNAFKFTKNTEHPVIAVGGRRARDESVYFVKDNGVGFDMKQAERLFTAFQRAHSATEFEGTGIGLSIVARIVRKHGGRIWVEAERGKGACFYFTLPDSPRVSGDL